MIETIRVQPKGSGSLRINTPTQSIMIDGVTEVDKGIYNKYLIGLVDIVFPTPEKVVVRKREIKEKFGGGE